MPFLTTCSLLSLFSVFSVSVNVITIITLKNSRMNKATVKVHPSKGHEGPEGEWKQTRYLLYRRLCRFQGLSGRVRKISPSAGIRTRTVQPAASRCTGCVIRAHTLEYNILLIRDGRYMCVCRCHEYVHANLFAAQPIDKKRV